MALSSASLWMKTFPPLSHQFSFPFPKHPTQKRKNQTCPRKPPNQTQSSARVAGVRGRRQAERPRQSSQVLKSVETKKSDIEDPTQPSNGSVLVEPAQSRLGELGLVGRSGETGSFGGNQRCYTNSVTSSTGLEASKLSPKKWGVSGSSRVVLVGFWVEFFLLSRGIDIRTNLTAVLGLAFLDSIFLGGVCLAQISSYWPPYKRRILVHEAGHLLVAYLMGCPIRGVILDPIVAMQVGIQGQAGTQFWDEKMSKELAEGRLSGTAFDRYCMVLFAGIAAEALVYGEAEGGRE
ncbi:hypothetical protein LWI28_026942 [Acer negundo]|uniref:Uncharacterized protein n=1 Tax=Acer negundo TaxID=4023 RepID=A0AAD5NKS5_ACENE|nr:hypothetical protein LWI28_026942 [Acer negundo]